MKPVRSEKTPIFRALAFLLLPVMNVLAKYVIHSPEKVPRNGAFVLAPNHYSEIDPIVMGVAMWRVGRMPRYLAKASLFKIPVVGWALTRAGQVPVERAGTRGSNPLAAARKIANEGLAVVIYPEGSLTRDPNLWPMRGKTGAVRIALEENLPIIPAAHWGTQLVMPRYSKRISFFPRKTIHITFGDPVDLSAFRGQRLDSKVLADATDVVMQSITALVEDLRGETAPATRWDPAKNNQSETGRFDQP
ncbi:MAG TPA: lysophospholipid acyltransferase family protein [Glaciihabitans sp.]|nr:lysophospholipid acyltransferase family protein [Glaciihabitans sp.]